MTNTSMHIVFHIKVVDATYQCSQICFKSCNIITPKSYCIPDSVSAVLFLPHQKSSFIIPSVLTDTVYRWKVRPCIIISRNAHIIVRFQIITKATIALFKIWIIEIDGWWYVQYYLTNWNKLLALCDLRRHHFSISVVSGCKIDT